MPSQLRDLELELTDMLVRFGLRRVQAMTDTHTVTVRETAWMDENYPSLDIDIKEHDV